MHLFICYRHVQEEPALHAQDTHGVYIMAYNDSWRTLARLCDTRSHLKHMYKPIKGVRCFLDGSVLDQNAILAVCPEEHGTGMAESYDSLEKIAFIMTESFYHKYVLFGYGRSEEQ